MAQNISLGGSTFKTMLAQPPERSDVSDVTWRKTPGGKEIATKYSDPLRRRGYQIWLDCTGSPDDETTWDTFIATLSGLSTSFAFTDHRGEAFTARFLTDPLLVSDEVDDILINIEVIEVRS